MELDPQSAAFGDSAEQWLNAPATQPQDSAQQWLDAAPTGAPVRNVREESLMRREREHIRQEGPGPAYEHPLLQPLNPIGNFLWSTATEYLPFSDVYAGMPLNYSADQAERINRGGGGGAVSRRMEALRQVNRETEDTRSLGENILHDILKLPKLLGEMYVGGQALGALGFAAEPAAGTGTIGKILYGAGRQAAASPLVPSTWVPEWMANNQQRGRASLDLRGLPSAALGGLVSNAIMGSTGGIGASIEGNAVRQRATRVLAQVGGGLAEQQGADAIVSTIGLVVPESWGVRTDFGTIGAILRGDTDKALRDVVRQGVTFAVLAGIHEIGHPTPAEPAQPVQPGQPLLAPPSGPAPGLPGPRPSPGSPPPGPGAPPGGSTGPRPRPAPEAPPGSPAPSIPSQVIAAMQQAMNAMSNLPRRVVAEQLKAVHEQMVFLQQQGMTADQAKRMFERDPSLEPAAKAYGQQLADLLLPKDAPQPTPQANPQQAPQQPPGSTVPALEGQASPQTPPAAPGQPPAGQLGAPERPRLANEGVNPLGGSEMPRPAARKQMMEFLAGNKHRPFNEMDWKMGMAAFDSASPEAQKAVADIATKYYATNVETIVFYLWMADEVVKGDVEGFTNSLNLIASSGIRKGVWDPTNNRILQALGRYMDTKPFQASLHEYLNRGPGWEPSRQPAALPHKPVPQAFSPGVPDVVAPAAAPAPPPTAPVPAMSAREAAIQAMRKRGSSEEGAKKRLKLVDKDVAAAGDSERRFKEVEFGLRNNPEMLDYAREKFAEQANPPPQEPLPLRISEVERAAAGGLHADIPPSLARAMADHNLPEPQQHIIRERYKGRSLNEVASDPEMLKKDGTTYTKERIRQLEKKTLAAMDEPGSMTELIDRHRRAHAAEEGGKGGKLGTASKPLSLDQLHAAQKGDLAPAMSAEAKKAQEKAAKREQQAGWTPQEKAWYEKQQAQLETEAVNKYLEGKEARSAAELSTHLEAFADDLMAAVKRGENPEVTLKNKYPNVLPNKLKELGEAMRSARDAISKDAKAEGVSPETARSAILERLRGDAESLRPHDRNTQSQPEATGQPVQPPGRPEPATGAAGTEQLAGGGQGGKPPEGPTHEAHGSDEFKPRMSGSKGQGRKGSIDLSAFGFTPELRDRVVAAFKALLHGLREWSSKMFPRVKEISRKVNECLSRFVGAMTHARMVAPRYLERIFRDAAPPLRRLWTTALMEMRFRYAEHAYLQEHHKATADAQAALARGDMAEYAQQRKREAYLLQRHLEAKNHTLVGFVNEHGETPLKDRAAFQSLLATPEFNQFLDRWREFGAKMDENYRRTRWMDVTDPINSLSQIPGLPINFIALTPGQASTAAMWFHSQRGNLRNPKSKKHPFDADFKGTAAGYETDPQKIIEQVLARTEMGAAKADLYKEAVNSGVARAGEAGKRPDAEYIHEVPGALPPKGSPFSHAKETSLWFKDEGAAFEFRKGLAVDQPHGLNPLARLINSINLFGPGDAMFHLGNIIGAELKNGRIPLFDSIKNAYNLLRGDAKINDLAAELARIGVSFRGGESHQGLIPVLDKINVVKKRVGQFLEFMDKVERIGLSQAFDRLVADNFYGRRFENTEANRRDFINSTMANYNSRSTHRWIQFLRDTGIQNFAVAASTFYMRGLREVAGFGEAIPSKGVGANLKGRIEGILRFAALAGGVIGVNAMIWGRPDGDDDTPLGALLIGHDAEGRSQYLNVLRFHPFMRGARATGLGAVVEGNRQGQRAEAILDRAWGDITSSVVHTTLGPVGDFAEIAMTGRDVTGHNVAGNAQGESHVGRQIGAAFLHANPVVGRFAEAAGMAPGHGREPTTTSGALLNVGRPFIGETNRSTAVANFQDRFTALGQQRQAAGQSNRPFEGEREYQILLAFHRPMLELEHAIAGVAQTPQGLRQVPRADEASIRQWRLLQAQLARQALEAIRRR